MASEKVSREMVLEVKYVNAKTRIVQMIELVFIWLSQQGLEEEECSPADERFSSVQVKVHVSK